MKKPVISPEQSLTFSDYFRLRASTEDILDYFGYRKQNVKLELPQPNRELPILVNLEERLQDALLHISLENEITRREFLIAPVMLEVRRLTESKLNSEYWFEFDHQLKGSFDYFFRSNGNLLVVEAKNADLSRGFTQLAVEMVALDKANETAQQILFGAVTTGNIWQFGKLDRAEKMFSQDIVSHDLSKDLQFLAQIFVGILEHQ